MGSKITVDGDNSHKIKRHLLLAPWKESHDKPRQNDKKERYHFADRVISGCFQGKPFNITVIQVYAPTTTAKEAEVKQFYENLLELIPSAKVGSQEIPRVTDKFGLAVQNEARPKLTVLPRERTGHSKHPLPTT